MNVIDTINEISMFKNIYMAKYIFHFFFTVFLKISNLLLYGLYHLIHMKRSF